MATSIIESVSQRWDMTSTVTCIPSTITGLLGDTSYINLLLNINFETITYVGPKNVYYSNTYMLS